MTMSMKSTARTFRAVSESSTPTLMTESRQTLQRNATPLRLVGCSVALLGALISTGAEAAAIAVQNYSFETPTLTPGSTLWSLDSWQQNNNSSGTRFFNLSPSDNGFFQATATSPLPGTADGLQAAQMANYDTRFWQNVGALAAETTYTLTVAAGVAQDNRGTAGGLIALAADGNISPYLVEKRFDDEPRATFSDYSVAFTTGGSVSGDLYIVLGSTNGSYLALDNVRLDASATDVPEPASMALLGLGLAGLGLARRTGAARRQEVAALRED